MFLNVKRVPVTIEMCEAQGSSLFFSAFLRYTRMLFFSVINIFFCATADKRSNTVFCFFYFRPCNFTSMCTHIFDKNIVNNI